jgi:hypothetical protein
MTIGHEFVSAVSPRRIGMLLPLGEWKHRKLLSMQEGDMVLDPEGVKARIVSKTVVVAGPGIAEALSQYLYGLPIDMVRKQMEEKWELEDDKLLYLVVEKT